MDSKKKLVFGVLIVALLGVGVFQFAGGSGDATPTKEASAKPEPTKANSQTVAVNIPPLGARDPFKPGQLPNGTPTDQGKKDPPPPKNDGGSRTPPIKDIFGGGGTTPMLPGPGGDIGTGEPTIHPAPQFPYVLVGVVSGETPAAVFADAAGNQRLITLGGSIDGDSKLLSITRGKATVKFGKETLTLTIGGTASAK